MATVLIVEDDDQVRVLAESYLQEQGHKTLTARTVDGALAVLETAEDIDILFTDVGLLDRANAGLYLAKHARQNRPALKVLYTTEQGVTDGMKALFVEDASLIEKPYTVDQLLASLGSHLETDALPSG